MVCFHLNNCRKIAFITKIKTVQRHVQCTFYFYIFAWHKNHICKDSRHTYSEFHVFSYIRHPGNLFQISFCSLPLKKELYVLYMFSVMDLLPWWSDCIWNKTYSIIRRAFIAIMKSDVSGLYCNALFCLICCVCFRGALPRLPLWRRRILHRYVWYLMQPTASLLHWQISCL